MAIRNGKEWLELITLDEDDMHSDSATDVATQQSIKAYADGKVLDEDDMASDSATQAPSQQSCVAYLDTVGDTLLENIENDLDTLVDDMTALINGKVLDEDDFATDSTTKAPSQQSAAAYIAAQVLDEDDMASDSATRPASQQSVKAYADGVGTAAETYADGVGTAANTYADGVGTAANTYSDGKVLDEDDFVTDSTTKAPSQQSAAAYIAAQVIDEDDMASDSATRPPSQQSVKAYADARAEWAKDTAVEDAEENATEMDDDLRDELEEYADDVGTAANTYSDGKVLDEDDFATDSTTKAPSQQSCAAYISANAGSMSQIPVTNVTTSGTTRVFGETVFIDHNTASSFTVTLPPITSSDYGGRVRVIIRRNAQDITIYCHPNDRIYSTGMTSMKTEITNTVFDFMSVGGGTSNIWLEGGTPNKMVAGNNAATYPDGAELITVEGSDNTIQLLTDTSVTGTADGFQIKGDVTAGLNIVGGTGNSYLTVESPGLTSQIKLVNSTLSEEWRITNTATSSLFQLRPGANPQVFVADYDTGTMAVGSITPPVKSPIRLGGSGRTTLDIPTFASNALAKAGGMTDGELYRLGDGTLMVVYT